MKFTVANRIGFTVGAIMALMGIGTFVEFANILKMEKSHEAVVKNAMPLIVATQEMALQKMASYAVLHQYLEESDPDKLPQIEEAYHRYIKEHDRLENEIGEKLVEMGAGLPAGQAVNSEARLLWVRSMGTIMPEYDKNVKELIAIHKARALSGDIPRDESASYKKERSMDEIVDNLAIKDWEMSEEIKKVAKKNSEQTLTSSRETVKSVKIVIILVFLVMLSAASLIGADFYIRIMGPIRALAVASEKARKGDLAANIDITGEDELARLCVSFNDLTKSLGAIVRKIHVVAVKTNVMAGQIRETTRQQSVGAKEQSAAVAEVTSTIEEHATSATHVAENAEKVLKITENNSEEINQFGLKTNLAAKKIVLLGEKSQSIGNITALLDEIADETNLLALNAAIEAARAGEAGKGFAVVAQEVGKLAERASESTEEIRHIIREIQDETRLAVVGIEELSKWSDKGAKMTFDVTDSVKSISLATRQQKAASDQIVRAMKNIDSVVRKFVESTAEVEAAMADLGNLSQDLTKTVDVFRTEEEHA